MREATIFRKKVRINEKDFKRILNRFDINKFKINMDGISGSGRTNLSCPLCKKYPECRGCQFKIFEDSHEGCIRVVISIIKNFKNLDDICINVDYIEFDNKYGKKKIQKIHNFLMTRFKLV